MGRRRCCCDVCNEITYFTLADWDLQDVIPSPEMTLVSSGGKDWLRFTGPHDAISTISADAYLIDFLMKGSLEVTADSIVVQINQSTGMVDIDGTTGVIPTDYGTARVQIRLTPTHAYVMVKNSDNDFINGSNPGTVLTVARTGSLTGDIEIDSIIDDAEITEFTVSNSEVVYDGAALDYSCDVGRELPTINFRALRSHFTNDGWTAWSVDSQNTLPASTRHSNSLAWTGNDLTATDTNDYGPGTWVIDEDTEIFFSPNWRKDYDQMTYEGSNEFFGLYHKDEDPTAITTLASMSTLYGDLSVPTGVQGLVSYANAVHLAQYTGDYFFGGNGFADKARQPGIGTYAYDGSWNTPGDSFTLIASTVGVISVVETTTSITYSLPAATSAVPYPPPVASWSISSDGGSTSVVIDETDTGEISVNAFEAGATVSNEYVNWTV